MTTNVIFSTHSFMLFRNSGSQVIHYERDILYPLATRNIEIDLDDGVKVNYPKFGKALKKVPGLS